jgi:hypothetical protein
MQRECVEGRLSGGAHLRLVPYTSRLGMLCGMPRAVCNMASVSSKSSVAGTAFMMEASKVRNIMPPS